MRGSGSGYSTVQSEFGAPQVLIKALQTRECRPSAHSFSFGSIPVSSPCSCLVLSRIVSYCLVLSRLVSSRLSVRPSVPSGEGLTSRIVVVAVKLFRSIALYPNHVVSLA